MMFNDYRRDAQMRRAKLARFREREARGPSKKVLRCQECRNGKHPGLRACKRKSTRSRHCKCTLCWPPTVEVRS